MPTLQQVVIRDTLANRPAASIPGRLFFASDTGGAYRDNGSSWDEVTAVPASEELVNAQTGTSYTVLDADRAHLLTSSNVDPVAFAIPETFAEGWFAKFSNLGAGTLTITPAGSPATALIDGASSLSLATGERAELVWDGTDFQLANLDRVAAAGLAKYPTSWSAQTSVTITHNLGTKDVLVQVRDSSDVAVIPESVTMTSINVVTLTFGAAFTGSAVVIG